jgi:hypothetical protein
MKQCKVCAKELPDEKFGNTYHTLSDGTRKAYKDSTCMACRRKKFLEKPENKESHKKSCSSWYRNNPEKAKEQRIRKYGITLDQYNQMRKDQNYCCAICSKHEDEVKQGKAVSSSTSLQIDHCHSTSKIRGLLCTSCNTLLGKAKDDVSVLEAAITYLKEQQ